MRRSRSDSEDSSGGENLLALGSSFITSGSLENSDSGGNGSKKQRLEFQGFEMSEFDSSNVGGVHQAGALHVDGGVPGDNLDMDVVAGKVSSHDDGISSGVTDDVLQPGSPRGEDI